MTTSYGFALQGSGVVIGDNATVRTGSDFDQAAVGMLSIGTMLTIQQEKDGWYQIVTKQPDLSGWIYKDLVVIQEVESGKLVRKARVTATVLNVRAAPSTESQRIIQLRSGDEIRIIGREDEWAQIILNDGQKGWVHSEYLLEIPNLPSAAVNMDNTGIYPTAALAEKPLQLLEKGTIVYIRDFKLNFYEVETEAGSTGWVLRDNVSLIINGSNPVSRGSLRNDADGFVSTVKKYLGSRYRYATAGPSTFDCSGFVYYILNTYYTDLLKNNGINLPRSSRAMAGVGTPVSRDALEVGDLVFFNNTGGTINHVGFYIGSNQFIHASSGSSMSVIISSLSEANYVRRYNTARRLTK
ncbi:MAG: SH3 domain-containing protein [Bacillota bacterium]|nr:SH3 domain-containing protein [Bacillota bacterium]